jgi:hypothetical protein
LEKETFLFDIVLHLLPALFFHLPEINTLKFNKGTMKLIFGLFFKHLFGKIYFFCIYVL